MNSSLTGRRHHSLRVFLLTLMTAGSVLAGWKEGTALPDLKKAGVEGTLPAISGKVILVDFWASWCAPCKASFSALDALQNDYKDKGFIVLGINVDEKADDMRRFLEEHTVSFPVVRDARQNLVSAADVQSMPSSFLVDRRGRVRFVHTGFHGEATLKEYAKEIETLLKEKP